MFTIVMITIARNIQGLRGWRVYIATGGYNSFFGGFLFTNLKPQLCHLFGCKNIAMIEFKEHRFDVLYIIHQDKK